MIVFEGLELFCLHFIYLDLDLEKHFAWLVGWLADFLFFPSLPFCDFSPLCVNFFRPVNTGEVVRCTEFAVLHINPVVLLSLCLRS